MRGLARLLRERMQMLREDALAVAQVVDEAFQGRSAVEDDDLDAELRQLFYDLQDAKVLQVQRREYEADGRLLRGYQWSVMEGRAETQAAPLRREADPDEDLYRSLGDDAWKRRQPPGGYA